MKIDNLSLYLLSEAINIFDLQLNTIKNRSHTLLTRWTLETKHKLQYLKPAEFEHTTGISANKIIDDAMSVKHVYLKNYLQLFRNIVSFLTHLIRSNLDQKQYIHLLPNLRALLEIVGNSLYTLKGDQKKAITIAFTRQIFTLSNIINVNKNLSEENSEVIDQYKKWYGLNLDLINFLEIPIPEDPKQFDYKYQRDKIKFPTMNEMLNPEWITEVSPETLKIFETVQENLYGLYSNLSNYVHGNSLLNSAYGREGFWILSHTIILSSLYMEIIDSEMLENSNTKRIEKWREMLRKEISPLSEAWKSTKTSW